VVTEHNKIDTAFRKARSGKRLAQTPVELTCVAWPENFCARPSKFRRLHAHGTFMAGDGHLGPFMREDIFAETSGSPRATGRWDACLSGAVTLKIRSEKRGGNASIYWEALDKFKGRK